MQICQWCASGNAQESQGFIFLNCPNRQVTVAFFFTTKRAKPNSRALRISQDLIIVRHNEYFHLNVVLCTQEITNEMICCAWLRKSEHHILRKGA